MQSNCVNLLEGYSPDMDLKDIEALLYENYQKYKAQGYDINAIFDQFIDNINKQETTNLDQTVSYTTFNNYDKITFRSVKNSTSFNRARNATIFKQFFIFQSILLFNCWIIFCRYCCFDQFYYTALSHS